MIFQLNRPLLFTCVSDRRLSTSGLRSFRIHEPTGAPNPRFLRLRISGGSHGLTAFFRRYFIVKPRTFMESGIEDAISISSRSTGGARHAMEAAIVILAV